MDVAEMKAYCLAKPGAWPDNPWDGEHPVIKVADGKGGGRIFVFLSADAIGLKGGPSREAADEWLDRFPGDATVMAYIGRSGWNNLSFTGDIPDEDLFDAIDESYRLVVSKIAKKHRPEDWDQ